MHVSTHKPWYLRPKKKKEWKPLPFIKPSPGRMELALKCQQEMESWLESFEVTLELAHQQNEWRFLKDNKLVARWWPLTAIFISEKLPTEKFTARDCVEATAFVEKSISDSNGLW